MSGLALITAACGVAMIGSSQRLIAGMLAAEDASSANIVTQGGVFALAIAIGYYFLRRSDSREKEQKVQAQADLKAMRDEMAIMRGEHLHVSDQYIEALKKNAVLMERILELEKRAS